MKKIFAMVALMLSTLVSAGEIPLKSFSQYELWGSPSVTPEFLVNEELGRAWVTIRVTMGYADGESSTEEHRVKVAGMSFDKSTGAILLDHEGKLSECAFQKTVGRSIFRHKEIKTTPACKFGSRWRDVSYDDGFEIKKTKRYDVFLIVE